MEKNVCMYVCMYVCVRSKESSQKILPPSTVEGEVNRVPMNVTCFIGVELVTFT